MGALLPLVAPGSFASSGGFEQKRTIGNLQRSPAITMGVPSAVEHADVHAALTLPHALTAPLKSRAAVTGQLTGGGDAMGGGGDDAAGAEQLPSAERTATGTPAAITSPALAEMQAAMTGRLDGETPAMTIGVPSAAEHAGVHAALTLPHAPTAPLKSRAAVMGHVAAGGGAVALGGGGCGGEAAAPQVDSAERTATGTPAAMTSPACAAMHALMTGRFEGETPAMTMGVPSAALQPAEQASDRLPQGTAAPEKSSAADMGHVGAAGGGRDSAGGGGDDADEDGQEPRAASTLPGTPAVMMAPAYDEMHEPIVAASVGATWPDMSAGGRENARAVKGRRVPIHFWRTMEDHSDAFSQNQVLNSSPVIINGMASAVVHVVVHTDVASGQGPTAPEKLSVLVTGQAANCERSCQFGLSEIESPTRTLYLPRKDMSRLHTCSMGARCSAEEHNRYELSPSHGSHHRCTAAALHSVLGRRSREAAFVSFLAKKRTHLVPCARRAPHLTLEARVRCRLPCAAYS